MDRGRKGIVDFNAGKTQLFFFKQVSLTTLVLLM